MVEPTGPSVWNLLHATFLAPTVLGWFVGFRKTVQLWLCSDALFDVVKTRYTIPTSVAIRRQSAGCNYIRMIVSGIHFIFFSSFKYIYLIMQLTPLKLNYEKMVIPK